MFAAPARFEKDHVVHITKFMNHNVHTAFMQPARRLAKPAKQHGHCLCHRPQITRGPFATHSASFTFDVDI
jgi:hypothetical protein